MGVGRRAGRGRTGGDLSQLGRDPAADVGLRRHRADGQTTAAGERAAAKLAARDPGVLLEFQVTVDLLELRNLATVAALIVDSAH